MGSSFAIRLGIEGGAEVKRVLDDTGQSGQAAFQKVTAASDAAGAAVDRQTARYVKLAQAAREAEAQARAQVNVNALLGVGQGSAGSARDSASVFEEALSRQDAIQAARRAQALLTSQASINQLLGVKDAQVGAARASASAFEDIYRQEAEALKRSTDLRTTAIRNAATGWRDLTTAGSTALANIEASRRLGSLGMATPAANQNTRLRADQVQNLGYQVGDVVAQLGSGSPLGMIALQQGPQIAQVFAGPGGASVKGAVTQAGEAVSGFVSRIGLVGGAIGGVTAAVVTGVAALFSYRSGQEDVERAVAGMGRASGVTVGQINAIANAQASSAGLSRSAARDMQAEFAGTGRIGVQMYAGLLGSARDYAFATKQDVPEATKALAEAFSDPLKGAEALNAQLGFLDDTTLQLITRLDAQGNRLGAQRALFDAYAGSVAKAAEKQGFFARQWEEFKTNTSNEFDAIGSFIDRGLGGGTAEERLAALRGQLDFRSRNKGRVGGIVGSALDSLLGFDEETIRTQMQAVQKEIDAGTSKIDKAQSAQRSLQAGRLIRSLQPETQDVQRLQDQIVRLREIVAKPAEFLLSPKMLAEAEAGLDRITRQQRTLNEEIGKYGSPGVAAAVRAAEFNNRTVGFTDLGRGAAEANRRFDEAILKGSLDPRSPSVAQVNATYDARAQNTDGRDLGALAEARQAAVRAAAEVEGLRRERDLTIAATTRATSLTEGALGGALSRMSSEVQAQILGASQRYGRIPAGVLAGIARPESGGNLDVGYSKALGEDGRPSSAYGLGQITRGTAEDAIRRGYLPQGFDRTNRATMADGIAGVLTMKLDDNGGDLTKAIMAYRGSNKPGVNEAYAAEVLRGAGQMGDASSLGRVRDLDALTRAQRDAGQTVEQLSKFYGTNGAALETAQRQQQKYTELLDRGVPAQEAAQIAYGGIIAKTVEFAQQARMVQFTKDVGFDREQLGRTASEQTAYARARSLVGDTTTPEAQFVIQQNLMNDNLRETKTLASSAFSGMLSDLRQGTSLTSTLTNMTNRLFDKLLSNTSDRLISSLFAGADKGGDGFLSWASSIFGSAGMPKFAEGGISDRPSIFGEAGPEAAVPLSRGRAIPVEFRMPRFSTAANINAAPADPPIIVNATPTPPATGQVQGPRGPRDVIVIGKTIAGALMDDPDVKKALAQAYGLKRTGR